MQVIVALFGHMTLCELITKVIGNKVGILARVPRASGLLTGKFKVNSQFESDDHRNFNRDGDAFNVGETFAGVEFSKGVELSDQLAWIADGRGNRTQAALKWILQQKAI